MVNNAHIIRPLLSFEDKHDFYFVQIIKRRKDNPEIIDKLVMESYYITSLGYFDRILPEIIRSCEFHNARAYFYLNKRNFTKLVPSFVQRTAQLAFDDPSALRNLYEKVVEGHHAETSKNKKWSLDIDWVDFPETSLHEPDFFETLYTLQVEGEREPINIVIPTKNGVHIVTHPFNVLVFDLKYPDIPINKDAMTILYCL